MGPCRAGQGLRFLKIRGSCFNFHPLQLGRPDALANGFISSVLGDLFNPLSGRSLAHIPNKQRSTRSGNGRLLASDGIQRFTEDFGVFQAQGRDQRHVGRGDPRGVQTPAKARFEQQRLNGLKVSDDHRHEEGRFEERELYPRAFNHVMHLAQAFIKAGWRDGPAVEPDALFNADEVG